MENMKTRKGSTINFILNTETRFKIGQKVKAYGRRSKKIPCPFCEGNYKKIIDGDPFYCANCDEGMMKLEEEDILVNAEVTGIYVDVRKSNVDEDEREDYTYADETGYKDIEYVLDTDEEDVHISMINEKKLIQWNE